MRIGEYISRIQAIYNRGIGFDGDRLSNRHIYSKMVTARAILLRQRFNKKQHISSYNYQTLPCVEIIPAKPDECDCIPSSECRVWRSRYQLPRSISGIDRDMIKQVTSIDNLINYTQSTIKKNRTKSATRYGKRSQSWYIYNKYLFLTVNDSPAAVSVTGLFTDPLDANEFPSICNNNDSYCENPLEVDFPIDDDLGDTMVEMIAFELIPLFQGNTEVIRQNLQRDQQEQQENQEA